MWRNGLGNLIDVSPQLGGRKRMLFLSDDSAIYDPMALRQNILAVDGDSESALQLVSLGNRRHRLLIRCRIPGTSELCLYPHDQLELAEIDRQIQEVMGG